MTKKETGGGQARLILIVLNLLSQFSIRIIRRLELVFRNITPVRKTYKGGLFLVFGEGGDLVVNLWGNC